MPIVKVEFTPYNHTPKDYRDIYKYLTDRFGSNTEDCPAILLLTSAEPKMFEDRYGDSVIFLDRNAKTLKGDLKRSLSRPSEKIDDELVSKLQTLWNPTCNYGVWYLWLLEIGNALCIDIPAFFICDQMMPGISKLNGVVFPGDDKPFATDIILRVEQNNTDWSLKTLLHEMRHVWQHKYHSEMFEGYGKYTESSKSTYSLQIAEIDADAYAYWVLAEYGNKYILDDLGEERCAAIQKRMREIAMVEQAPKLSHLIIKGK